MTDELQHMQNQIRSAEDYLLRSKDRTEQESMSYRVMEMRKELQKMEFKQRRWGS